MLFLPVKLPGFRSKVNYVPNSNRSFGHIHCDPFLKWPGGKRWLVKRLVPAMSKSGFNNYYEPFLGGGAVYFALAPDNAILSDLNGELISTYRAVKSAPSALLKRLKEFEQSKGAYYEVREQEFRRQKDIAARFLYLNRLGFAGMYRVNRNGKFNVPYGGRKMDILWEKNLIINASKALQAATLSSCSFEEMITQAEAGDLIYCDPTYTVAHNDNGFLRYNENVFHWSDQKKLAELCKEAARKGVQVVVSNAAHPSIAKLYHPYKPIIVQRHTCVSRTGGGRKKVDEYVFVLNGNRNQYKKHLLSND